MTHPAKPTKLLTQAEKQFIQSNETLRLAFSAYMQARENGKNGLIGNAYYERERLRMIYRILRY